MKYLVLILLLTASYTTVAQKKMMRRIVVDGKETPIMAASVSIYQNEHWDFFSMTDDDGTFCWSEEGLYSNQDVCFLVEVSGYEPYESCCWKGEIDTIRLLIDTCSIKDISNIKFAKPAIYLYPTQKTTINIQHDFKGSIGTTYPAYKNGWKVIAEPNGALVNLADNRKYEYLFWDGTYTFPATHFDYKEGFVVAKENTTDFLWKQLAHIGLNEKEINDFVVYWLPQLERNEHNFFYFHINNDIDHSSVLTVQPQPDSWIRLFMEFKSVPANYSIAEQQLPAIKRNGFTLVEWGGAVIENSATNLE